MDGLQAARPAKAGIVFTASRASKQAARTSIGLVLFDKTTYSLKFASYLAGLSKISRQILLGIPGSLIPRVMIC